MPLVSGGIFNVGGDMSNELRTKLDNVFKRLDKFNSEISKEKGLTPAQVKLLRPCNLCVIINDDYVFIVISNIILVEYYNAFILIGQGKK